MKPKSRVSAREVAIVAGVVLFLGIGLAPIVRQRRDQRNAADCRQNLKQVGLAMMQYTRDYDEKFPPPEKCLEVLWPYGIARRVSAQSEYLTNPQILSCPSAPFGYAMNRFISGVHQGLIEDYINTPACFDSNLQIPNASDDGKSWPNPVRHPRGNNVCFVDGHVKPLLLRPVFKSLFMPAPPPKIKPRRVVPAARRKAKPSRPSQR